MTQSHTLSTVSLGRHVANSVRNHCMEKTFVNGGSTFVPTEWRHRITRDRYLGVIRDHKPEHSVAEMLKMCQKQHFRHQNLSTQVHLIPFALRNCQRGYVMAKSVLISFQILNPTMNKWAQYPVQMEAKI